MYVSVGVRTEGIEYGWIYSTNLPDRGMCMHVVNGVSVDPFFYPSPPTPESSRSSRSYVSLAVFYDQVVKPPSRS